MGSQLITLDLLLLPFVPSACYLQPFDQINGFGLTLVLQLRRSRQGDTRVQGADVTTLAEVPLLTRTCQVHNNRLEEHANPQGVSQTTETEQKHAPHTKKDRQKKKRERTEGRKKKTGYS